MNVTTVNSRLFEATKAQGKLKGIALDVYSIICGTPGLTGGEIFRRYERMNPGTDRARNEIAKRITDLANWGGVRADGVTICPESGRMATRWVPTGEMPRVRERKNEGKAFVPDVKTPLVPSNEHLVKRNESLEQALNVSVELAERRAETISTQNKEITRLQNSLTNAELVRRADLDIAYKSRNEAQARADFAAQRELTARQELADLKASTVTVPQEYEDYIRTKAAQQGLPIEKVISLAMATYALRESGELVERRKRVEKQKSPAGVEAKAQLQALAARSRFLLKFRRFLPKRLVQQAEATLKALDFATETL